MFEYFSSIATAKCLTRAHSEQRMWVSDQIQKRTCGALQRTWFPGLCRPFKLGDLGLFSVDTWPPELIVDSARCSADKRELNGRNSFTIGFKEESYEGNRREWRSYFSRWPPPARKLLYIKIKPLQLIRPVMTGRPLSERSVPQELVRNVS